MNEENTYNLIDEPWIPVMMQDGTNRNVSLGEVFADADGQIADLALNPYERVAVFRLLLCIAQASLSLEQVKDERAWLAAHGIIGVSATGYLKVWHDRFNLYGDHAFLQVDCLEPGGTIPDASRFLLNSAHHFGSPLFSREIDMTGQAPMASPLLAIALLSYLSFSASGGTPTCKWKGIPTKQVGASASPCRGQSKLFTLVCGKSLLESVWMNLLTEKQLVKNHLSLGRPCWEFLFDNCLKVEEEAFCWLGSIDKDSREVLEPTWLGTLVPLSRFVKLKRSTSECLICEGFGYPQPPLWREPEATFFTRRAKEDATGILCLRTDPNREPWRDLSSILEMRSSKGGAIALEHLLTLAHHNTSIQYFSIWTGGMNSKADRDQDMWSGEWRFTRPISHLRKSSLDQYREAADFAAKQLFFRGGRHFPDLGLKAATREYATCLLIDKASRFSDPAERIYWDILAQPANQTIVSKAAEGSPDCMDKWKMATHKAAEEAYRRVCPAATARQMEAYAQGFAKLWVPDGKKGKAIDNADSGGNEGGDHV